MNVAFIKPKEIYEAGKLAKRIRRQVGEAIADFNMIGEGDKVMVCLSGGKDSYGLLDVLLSLKDRAPFAFGAIAQHRLLFGTVIDRGDFDAWEVGHVGFRGWWALAGS
jgi:hypothetical protein